MSDELADLTLRVARLEAESAVRRTFNEYIYNTDWGYADGRLDAFTRDAHLTLINFPPGSRIIDLNGHEEIYSFFIGQHPSVTKFLDFLASSFAEENGGEPIPDFSAPHYTSNVAVVVDLEHSSAELSAYLLNAGFNLPALGVLAGMYEATLRLDGDKWRMAECRILGTGGWRPSDGKALRFPLPAREFLKRGGRPPR